jgi:hypothetical protein
MSIMSDNLCIKKINFVTFNKQLFSTQSYTPQHFMILALGNLKTLINTNIIHYICGVNKINCSLATLNHNEFHIQLFKNAVK